MSEPVDPSSNETLNRDVNSASVASPEAPKKFTVRGIFVGADGIRAGWSLLIFVVLMLAILRGATIVGNRMHWFPKQVPGRDELTLRFAFVGEAIPLLVTLLVTWIMSKIERRPRGVYGLGHTRALPNLFAGLAWGVAFLSVLVLTLRMAGLLVFDSRLLSGGEAFRYGVLWLLGFAAVGMLEEYLTRGYVLFTLTRGLAGIYSWLFKAGRENAKALGFWTSAALLSVGFGLGHRGNPGESPIGLLSAGLVSLVFCLSLWRSGSLWWAIGFHAAWDWAQSFLYGVADSGIMVQHHLMATHPVGQPLLSGGTTGPEGSVFVLPLLVLLVLVIWFTVPRAQYGDATVRTS